MTGLRSARSAGVRGASPPAQTLQLRPLPVSCQPCTSAPNSQRRQFLRPLSCAHWKRGLPRQVPAFAGPSPRLAGLSSITQAGPCGHHVSLRRRRSSRVPEQPPPMAPRMGRVFLPGPGPRPGGRGPRASCVAAQTRRRVGGAHAAAAGGAGHGGAGCGAANAGPHPRIQTHSLSRPGRRSSRAAPPAAPRLRSGPRLQSCSPRAPPPPLARSPGSLGRRAEALAGLGRGPGGPTYPLLPKLRHRLSLFRRGQPPSVSSQTPAACTLSSILKTNRRRRLPAALAGLPLAGASPGREVCWRGPGGTRGLSPLSGGAGASAHPAPVVSASRSLSLPSCHPQYCDAVSGLHCSDSSVELTA